MTWIYYEQSGDALVEVVPCTILRVVPKGTVEVTEKPVESGVTLTDHVVVKTRRLSATVFFSPIPPLPGSGAVQASATNPGLSVAAAQTLLRMIQETRKLNTVTVPGDTDDDDLILESWTTTRENAAGNGGEFE